MNLKRSLLITLLLLGQILSVLATRPTKHASNFKITNVACNSFQLNWAYGDGNARLVVAREGAPTTWEPTDYSNYSPNSDFGKGSILSGPGGTDSNFVVYNAGGTNYVKIDSLKTGKTYYFTIFEHDNAGANVLYYTSGAPSVYETTYTIKPSFTFTTTDSCEAHNLFTFTNTSISTVPNISYTFDFGDGLSSTSSPVNHQYMNKSGKLIVQLNVSPGLGCINTCSTTIRIYPKKVAYIDFTKFDTTQCFYGNYFEVDPLPIVSPLPKSFTYNWNYGDSSKISTFKKMKKSYTRKGRYNVSLEIRTNVNLYPTSCSDTLRFTVFVPSPSCKTSVKDSTQCLTNNLFNYVNSDASSQNYMWYFGDGDSSNTINAQHGYKNTGIYFARYKVSDINGCNKEDTLKVEVISYLNSAFSGLDTVYCSSNNDVILAPLYPGGKFSGYPVTGNILRPNIPGKYTLSYKTTLVNCNNTVNKNFRIKISPTVTLGNDTLITSSQNLTLDAGIATSYLWSTSATTRTLQINGQTAPKGSTKYSVEATNNIGCKGYDTITVSVDYISSIGQLSSTALQVYPNPVTNVLNIANPGNTEFKWEIFNINGQKIIAGDQQKNQIDLTNMTAGIYMLELKTNSGNSVVKLIKL